MPIFQKDGKTILFVHVPKAGGTYIEELFRKNGFSVDLFDNRREINPYRVCSPQHYHAEIINKILVVDRFDYVFMTVRHPVSRFVSEFRMRCMKRLYPLDINAWADSVMQRYVEDEYMYDNHIRPQSEFVLKNIDIYKQDMGFGEEFGLLLEEKIGIKLRERAINKVRVREVSDYKSSNEVLSEDNLQRIRMFYAMDFARFNYNLEGHCVDTL